jgi:hypothetical protein
MADFFWKIMYSSEPIIVEHCAYEFETLVKIRKYITKQALIKFQQIFYSSRLKTLNF